MPRALHTRQSGKIIKGFFRISPNSIPNQISAFLILYFQSLHHPFSYQALASLRNGWGELENREKGEGFEFLPPPTIQFRDLMHY